MFDSDLICNSFGAHIKANMHPNTKFEEKYTNGFESEKINESWFSYFCPSIREMLIQLFLFVSIVLIVMQSEILKNICRVSFIYFPPMKKVVKTLNSFT